MNNYGSADLKNFLEIWGWPLFWLLEVTVSAFLIVALASLVWMLIPIVTLTGGMVLGGVAIYQSCAAQYVEKYKRKGMPPSYRAQVRVLKRKIRSSRNQVWSYKDYPLNRDKYYAELIDAERKLAALREVDYEEPLQKPSERW